MRALFRLLLVLGVLLGASSLSPLASATPEPTPAPSVAPSSSPESSSSESSSPQGSSPSSTGSADATTATPSSAESDEPKTTPSGTGSEAEAAVAAEPPTTQILTKPTNPTLSRSATFTFRTDEPRAAFECRLDGPGQSRGWLPCDPGTQTQGEQGTTGKQRYTGLAPSRTIYTFQVRAEAIPTPPEDGTTPAPPKPGPAAQYRWRVFSVEVPNATYSPGTGARFNNPLGGRTANRRNLTHVIKLINSMPGYPQAYRPGAKLLCPRDPALVPSTIRVSLYSVTDGRFADAMIAAHRRCASVRILMNNHLGPLTAPAMGRMMKYFGTRPFDARGQRRSWAKRCSSGCRGIGVLHSKFYLFDAKLPAPATSRNRINDTVVVGSSNMTSNAAKIQWNDLFTVRGRGDLFDSYSDMFQKMTPEGVDRRLVTYSDPPYFTTFWPQPRGSTDRLMTMLKSMTCRGANGGAGINGRTVVYINMHAWFGDRGDRLAAQVRRMYGAGCYVRVLYSFMAHRVFVKLKRDTGSRMSVRRTLFSVDGDKYADVYSHYKAISASGNVGGDRSAWVTWTGSHNFTEKGFAFDEVMMRIPSRTTFRQYRDQFQYISRRKSSATYANYSEPSGGGRPPAAKAEQRTAAAAQQRSQTILPDKGTLAAHDGEVVVE